MGGHGINGKNSLEQEGPYKGRMYNASCTERKALRWHMVEGCRGLELGALPEYTPPLPRAGPGANVSHEVAMILIDGKQTARDIRAELKAQVEAAVSAGRRAPAPLPPFSSRAAAPCPPTGPACRAPVPHTRRRKRPTGIPWRRPLPDPPVTAGWPRPSASPFGGSPSSLCPPCPRASPQPIRRCPPYMHMRRPARLVPFFKKFPPFPVFHMSLERLFCIYYTASRVP